MERIGLTYVRTFPTSTIAPVEGVHEGEVEYEITQEQWQRGTSLTPRALMWSPAHEASAPRAAELRECARPRSRSRVETHDRLLGDACILRREAGRGRC